MAKKTGLGRGIDALFDNIVIEPEGVINSDSIAKLGIDEIKPNSNQPRKTFDEEKIKDLAASIVEHGVIQPIVVRKIKNGYEIVAGERRWRAARVAELKEVPCIVRELTDEQNMLFAIIENMQREDLNPIEEAEGLEKMMSKFGLTQVEVSKSVGKSRPYVSNSLRLLRLPEEIRGYIVEGKLSVGHGRALIAVEDENTQLEIAEKVIREELSVRAIEEIVAGKKSYARGKAVKRTAKGNDVIIVEKDLKKVLGTKVNIKNSGNKGKIEIEYYNREELERIIEMLKNAN